MKKHLTRQQSCRETATNPLPRQTTLATLVLAACTSFNAHAELIGQQSLYRNADTSRWSDNYIELGYRQVVVDNKSNLDTSYKFGEFSGMNEAGGYPIAGMNWLFNNRENDAAFFRINASNIGLDSRKTQLEAGKQGAWVLSISADQLKRSETDTASFIHAGLGTNTLTLSAAQKAAGISQPPTNGSTTVNPFLHNFKIEQNRDINRIGLNGVLSSNWDLKVNFREDRRDGTRLTGAPVGTGAGAVRSVLVPYAIDDKTQQIETTLAYTTKQAQFQLAYAYSRYDNEFTKFSWESPYAAIGTMSPGGIATMSLTPSNESHNVSLTGGYNFSKTTRLSAQVSKAISTQDEAFLPYTSNTPATTVTTALPRTSLDGKIINTVADVTLTTRPLEKMNLKAAYQYRETDNRTPTATYQYVILDSVNQPAIGANNAAVRTNVPQSNKERKFILDADYEIFDRTRLRAAAEHRSIDYVNADVTSANENKATLELRRAISSEFTGALSLARKERRTDNYNKNQFFNKSYGVGFITANFFDNNPQMRQFLYGDYNEDRAKVSGNWNATETLTIQASVDGYQQKYKMSCGDVADDSNVAAANITWTTECLGRKKANGGSATLDTQWQADETLSTFAFYTYSQYGVDQLGRSWTTRTNAATGPQNTAKDFTVESDFRDHTAGLGLKWQATAKWEIGSQYVFTRSQGSTKVTTASALAAATAIPDNTTQLQTAQIFAKWMLNSRTTVRLNYLVEKLKVSDWSYDHATAISSNNVLLTGQTSPRYTNHVFGASVALSTW